MPQSKTIFYRIDHAEIRRLRELQDMTQNELAIAAAVSTRHQISLIESGGVPNMPAVILARMADALGCAMDDLVKRDTNARTRHLVRTLKRR